MSWWKFRAKARIWRKPTELNPSPRFLQREGLSRKAKQGVGAYKELYIPSDRLLSKFRSTWETARATQRCDLKNLKAVSHSGQWGSRQDWESKWSKDQRLAMSDCWVIGDGMSSWIRWG
jgi:hypothetical protein